MDKLDMKNVLVIDASQQFHFEVMSLMKEKTPIRYGYMYTGSPFNYRGDIGLRDKLIEAVSDEQTIRSSVEDFLFPKNMITYINEEWTVDIKLIEALKQLECYFLRLTDRSSAFPISVHERREYYLILLNYVHSVVRDKTGEVCFDYALTFDTPHGFFSYLLYGVLKYYHVPMIRIEHHFLDNHALIIKNDLPKIPGKYYEEATSYELKEKLPRELIEDYMTYNRRTALSNKNEQKALVSSLSFSGLRLFLRYMKKSTANLIMGFLPFLFKREVLHFTSLNGIYSRLYYRYKINKPLKELLKLNHYYNKISIEPDLSQKYIFFGMHMQPEKTSQPLGGEFDHMLLSITMLANSLPEGWHLYVKEHPNQFNERKIVNNNYRDKYFYQAVLKLKNVSWVSLHTPSSVLIKQAQLVSTLTGTMGWEGLLEGVPVIVFGEAYYKACRAVRSPQSVDECREAILSLSKLNKEDIRKEIYRYFLFYTENKNLIYSGRYEEEFTQHKLPRKDQIENLCNGILKKLNI